jgi:hypothetical protein
MASHQEIAQRWVNGKAGNGYGMHTDGQNLYSHQKRIGRTLEDGTKQILDLTGVYRVSASTGKHIMYAFRSAGYDCAIAPYVRAGYEQNSDFMGNWNVLDFPNNKTALQIRATKQTWKTYKGASAALLKINNPDYIIWELDNGKYTLSYMQYVDDNGKVTTFQNFYNL